MGEATAYSMQSICMDEDGGVGVDVKVRDDSVTVTFHVGHYRHYVSFSGQADVVHGLMARAVVEIDRACAEHAEASE